jgi:hypothetical protein
MHIMKGSDYREGRRGLEGHGGGTLSVMMRALVCPVAGVHNPPCRVAVFTPLLVVHCYVVPAN